VFFHPDRDAITLLSGVFVTDDARAAWRGTPGLGDARWRLRELTGNGRPEGVASGRLVLDILEDIKGQPLRTHLPGRRLRASPLAEPELVDFTQVYGAVIREAELEGPAAIAHLRDLEDRFRLALTLMRRRQECGLTQRQLASLTGTPQYQISRMEAGLANPTLRTVGALARALGIELTVGRSDVA